MSIVDQQKNMSHEVLRSNQILLAHICSVFAGQVTYITQLRVFLCSRIIVVSCTLALKQHVGQGNATNTYNASQRH